MPSAHFSNIYTLLHQQQNQRQHNPAQRKVQALFENFRLGHKHPEGGDREKQERQAEEDIEEEQRLGRFGFVQMRHLFQYRGEFFQGVASGASSTVVGTFFKIINSSFRLLYG